MSQCIRDESAVAVQVIRSRHWIAFYIGPNVAASSFEHELVPHKDRHRPQSQQMGHLC